MSTFASEMEISARMEKVQVVVAFFHLNGS
jgi:hypothetical protein